MLSLLEKVGCKIDPDNIEDCHRLSKKNDSVIIKFSRRKYFHMSFALKRVYEILTRRFSVFMGEIKVANSFIVP